MKQERLPGAGVSQTFGLVFIRSPLIPHVSLVERDVVLAAQFAKFLLKGLRLVMRLLPVNITNQIIQLAVADRKCAVTSLPEEGAIVRSLRFDPRRSGFLDLFQEVCL